MNIVEFAGTKTKKKHKIVLEQQEYTKFELNQNDKKHCKINKDN